jgi:hypothetical protein
VKGKIVEAQRREQRKRAAEELPDPRPAKRPSVEISEHSPPPHRPSQPNPPILPAPLPQSHLANNTPTSPKSIPAHSHPAPTTNPHITAHSPPHSDPPSQPPHLANGHQRLTADQLPVVKYPLVGASSGSRPKPAYMAPVAIHTSQGQTRGYPPAAIMNQGARSWGGVVNWYDEYLVAQSRQAVSNFASQLPHTQAPAQVQASQSVRSQAQAGVRPTMQPPQSPALSQPLPANQGPNTHRYSPSQSHQIRTFSSGPFKETAPIPSQTSRTVSPVRRIPHRFGRSLLIDHVTRYLDHLLAPHLP